MPTRVRQLRLIDSCSPVVPHHAAVSIEAEVTGLLPSAVARGAAMGSDAWQELAVGLTVLAHIAEEPDAIVDHAEGSSGGGGGGGGNCQQNALEALAGAHAVWVVLGLAANLYDASRTLALSPLLFFCALSLISCVCVTIFAFSHRIEHLDFSRFAPELNWRVQYLALGLVGRVAAAEGTTTSYTAQNAIRQVRMSKEGRRVVAWPLRGRGQ